MNQSINDSYLRECLRLKLGRAVNSLNTYKFENKFWKKYVRKLNDIILWQKGPIAITNKLMC